MAKIPPEIEGKVEKIGASLEEMIGTEYGYYPPRFDLDSSEVRFDVVMDVRKPSVSKTVVIDTNVFADNGHEDILAVLQKQDWHTLLVSQGKRVVLKNNLFF